MRADSAGAAPARPGTFRVVFIADTHVIGPQYACCSESPGLDNDSIMKTPERLARVRDQVNALDPAPDLVFVLGDVVHDAHHFRSVAEYRSEETGFSRASELFSDFEMPVHFVWGNHDYELDCSGEGAGHWDRAFTHQIFETLFDSPPTSVVNHKGWRFLLTNSQLGPTWTPGDPQCNPSLASYGADQLAWVDAQLAEGLPTMVMAHYYSAVTAMGESPADAHPDLMTVLRQHDNMRLFLAGHAHRWIDLRTVPDLPQVVLGATRYDTDNFWLFEFDEDGDEYRILDEDKPVWYTTCADTWRYDGGAPALDPSAAEEGDCGSR